ncbi:hypothetical protein DIPPA_29324 [Diplonema papillatum]|nr:hypothetical protein DIPPA_29324 [Diplonema papillatum]
MAAALKVRRTATRCAQRVVQAEKQLKAFETKAATLEQKLATVLVRRKQVDTSETKKEMLALRASKFDAEVGLRNQKKELQRAKRARIDFEQKVRRVPTVKFLVASAAYRLFASEIKQHPGAANLRWKALCDEEKEEYRTRVTPAQLKRREELLAVQSSARTQPKRAKLKVSPFAQYTKEHFAAVRTEVAGQQPRLSPSELNLAVFREIGARWSVASMVNSALAA